MADISITAANVTATEGEVSKQEYVAGAAITAGQTVYIDTADSNKAKLADADSTAAIATVKGIAMCNASTGQPVLVATSGNIDVGATLTVGEIYVQSGTAGGIAPEADLATDDYVSLIGIATAADNLKISIVNSGAQIP